MKTCRKCRIPLEDDTESCPTCSGPLTPFSRARAVGVFAVGLMLAVGMTVAMWWVIWRVPASRVGPTWSGVWPIVMVLCGILGFVGALASGYLILVILGALAMRPRQPATPEREAPATESSARIRALSHCLAKDLEHILDDPRYSQVIKAIFRELRTREYIDGIMEIVAEKIGESAADGKSHSRQIRMPSRPVAISIAVWPDCTLDDLAERFQQQYGEPYMRAADVYIRRYAEEGCRAYVHLFFCYKGGDAGVGTALVPCDEDFARQCGSMLLPVSIKRQTDQLMAAS